MTASNCAGSRWRIERRRLLLPPPLRGRDWEGGRALWHGRAPPPPPPAARKAAGPLPAAGLPAARGSVRSASGGGSGDHSVGSFIVQRLSQTLFVVLAAALISFALIRYIGDPVNNMVGQAASL